MPIDQATFLRIDTLNSTPCLEGSLCELAVSSLIEGHKQGWYELLGFVVLPSEIQLMIVSRGKATKELLKFFEAQIQTVSGTNTTFFDTEYYREKVDILDEIRNRLRWMYAAPVRSRLATTTDSYPYSSANSRFRDIITTHVM
jgi:hypothetical protein